MSDLRPTAALVRPAAVQANVRCLAELARGSALCAVVKADGYGHGAPVVARAAVAGGASWLAVATVEEALEIAEAVSGEVPVLVLSEVLPDAVGEADRCCPDRVRFTVASPQGAAVLAEAASARDRGAPRRVHLKVDTGMHRIGVDPRRMAVVADSLVRAGRQLSLEGVWTHLAAADDPADGFTGLQLRRFAGAISRLRRLGMRPDMAHAANSAGLLAHPGSHLSMARAGIAIYGVPPTAGLSGLVALKPALSLSSRVSAVRTVAAGERVSYGGGWRAGAPTCIATVPVGYADGIRRDSGAAGVEVLVRGQRCGIAGAVTMDQLMVALPDGISDEVGVGDEVVLIGAQGCEEVTVTEIADRLGTIPYEVLVGLSARVPRITHAH